jgi:coenzyme F420 hydrogenase subunit beta
VDNSIRNASSSGGAVSTLLSSLLHSGKVEKALIVRPSSGRAYRAETSFVSDVAGCLSASRSWYLPFSMENAVRELQEVEGRCAVVGLPCHIQAWRKAAETFPDITRKITVHIGLFCSHVVDVRFWRLLLRLSGIPPDRVRRISFRGRGWPGSIRVELEEGKVRTIPYDHALRKLLWKIYIYTPRRCLMCYDFTSEFSDVSVGDAWLPEFKHDRSGRNTVIVRSRIGEEVCREAVDSGNLYLEPIEAEKLQRSQRFDHIMKKRDIGARYNLLRSIGLRVPSIGTDHPKPSPAGYLYGTAFLVVNHISNRGWFEFLTRLLP